MSVLLGNAVLMFVDGQAVGCTTGGSITIEGQEIETTCKDNNGAYTSVIGSDRWTGEISGNFNDESSLGLEELMGLKHSKALIGVKMSVINPVNGSTVSGGLYFAGYARITNLTWSSDINAPSTYTISLSGSGDWQYGTTT